jgi:hypothetical protein
MAYSVPEIKNAAKSGIIRLVTPEGLLASHEQPRKAARDPSGLVTKVEQEKRAMLCETLPFVANLMGLNSNHFMLDLKKINGLIQKLDVLTTLRQNKLI